MGDAARLGPVVGQRPHLRGVAGAPLKVRVNPPLDAQVGAPTTRASTSARAGSSGRVGRSHLAWPVLLCLAIRRRMG